MKPTIGRIVHYHPPCALTDDAPADATPPIYTYAAIVVDVIDEQVILKVFPPEGDDHIVRDARPSESPQMGTWTWPARN